MCNICKLCFFELNYERKILTKLKKKFIIFFYLKKIKEKYYEYNFYQKF